MVGYFRYLRALLNARVPSSLEPSVVAPTPMAAAIKDLIMSPLHFSCQPSNEEETVFTANNRYVVVLPLSVFNTVCAIGLCTCIFNHM